MGKIQRKGASEARKQLPALLNEAKKGRPTIITRHGRPIAALIPVKTSIGCRQKALTGLAGSGKGMWDRDSTRAVRRPRDEWGR